MRYTKFVVAKALRALVKNAACTRPKRNTKQAEEEEEEEEEERSVSELKKKLAMKPNAPVELIFSTATIYEKDK